MKANIRHAALTDIGRVRQTNEDCWTADAELGLYIVADGMGGESAGTLASTIVVATLPELVRQSFAAMDCLPRYRAMRLMAKAIATLSRHLRQQTQNEPALAGMGSTVVCALVRDAQALVAHMGDSRAYRLRASQLKQITRDHTIVQLLLDSGDITPEEAADHPARGRLTCCVGMAGEPLPQVNLLTLKPGDLLLLCTDGLTGMIGHDQIRSILCTPAPLESRCRSLVDSANRAGGEDNITVLLLAFEGIQEECISSSGGTAFDQISTGNSKESGIGDRNSVK
jgi:serine/threonine protein phosphatase PrpC